MLLSIATILLCGMFAGHLCKKIQLPGLLGMIMVGIVLGPGMLNMLDDSLLAISADIRKIALIIILTRAGLTLELDDLKKIGRPAVMMCFVPACLEMIGTIFIGSYLFDMPYLDAAIMGAALAAVSPAVIVPKMIQLIEKGYGIKKGIPQLILAGAAVDDVFVIVMFSAFTGIAQGETISVVRFINIPISIILGMALGYVTGRILARFFNECHMLDTMKIMTMLGVFLIAVTIEDLLPTAITFSALIAVMFTGIGMQKESKTLTKQLSGKFNQIWSVAEIMLFVLVGATVDIGYAVHAGAKALLLIVLVLIFRIVGVCLCLIGTDFNAKERLFCGLGYMPKATVQAAIGGMPLAMGLACGPAVLTVAVLSILLTAPLGAFLLEHTYQHLLTDDKKALT